MSYLIKARPSPEGATRIAAPGVAALRYLEFSLLSLSLGQSHTVPADEQETVVYLLSGQGEVAGAPQRDAFVLGPRANAFTDAPWAVYVPPRVMGRITRPIPWRIDRFADHQAPGAALRVDDVVDHPLSVRGAHGPALHVPRCHERGRSPGCAGGSHDRRQESGPPGGDLRP